MPGFGNEEIYFNDDEFSREQVTDAIEMNDKLEGKPESGYEEFQWSKDVEPHQIRQRALIRAHPEVRTI